MAPRPGLCGSCRHAQVVEGARSTFWRCGMHDEDPERFPKYPPMPVVECGGYEEDEGGEEGEDGEGEGATPRDI